MNKISELKRILGETFVWNKAHLDCFVRQQQINFYIRIKEGSVLHIRKKKLITANNPSSGPGAPQTVLVWL
jgi:hypothetical protein